MPMASFPDQLSLSWSSSKHSFLLECPSFQRLGDTAHVMCSEEHGPCITQALFQFPHSYGLAGGPQTSHRASLFPPQSRAGC